MGGRGARRWGRASRATALGVLMALGATLAVIATPVPASADARTETNAAAQAVPALGTGDASGSPSSVYPAPITVLGMTGSITKVTVRLNNLTHSFTDDLDVLLVGPSGQSVVLLSDAGQFWANNVTPTFDDAAAGPVPASPGPPQSGLGSGTYRPTNNVGGEGVTDVFPAPAPAGPYGSTLGAFNGTNPNGTWNLYVVDDTNGDAGALAGGWTLDIETPASPGLLRLASAEFRGTEGGGVATVTIERVAGDDGAVGVVFNTGTGTATAGVDYGGISQFVTFADGQTTRTVDVPIADDPVVEGIDELVPITLSAPTGGATLGFPATGNVRIQDNDARANAFPITIPAPSLVVGRSDPYPSNIVVAGAVGVVTDVDVTLDGLSHTFTGDLDIMLVGPNGASTWLMGDAGPPSPVSNLDITFSDEAAAGIDQSSLTTGTYRPTLFDDGAADPFPAPAPATPSNVSLAALDGSSPNGTWSLYVVDDAGGDVGDIGGGWSLALTTTTASAGGPTPLPRARA